MYTSLKNAVSDNPILLDELEFLIKQAERYEKLRKLNVPQFQDLFKRNLVSGVHFDKLVDEL